MEKKERRKFYTCKRSRMLDYLLDKGFTPSSEGHDWNNPKYKVWHFVNTPELEVAVNEYFNR